MKVLPHPGCRAFPRVLLILIVVLGGFAEDGFADGIPRITDFSSGAAVPGEVITITGENFPDAIGGIQVRFGAVLGTVLDASNHHIEVEVPAGATYAPVSVRTTDGRYAFSPDAFVPMFASSGPVTSSSFVVRGSGGGRQPPAESQLISLSTERFGPAVGTVVADFDGNGRSDIAVASMLTDEILVFRNDNSGADLLEGDFEIAIVLDTGVAPGAIMAGDLNGNGLLDLIVVPESGLGLIIFENISSPGAISFAEAVTISTDDPHTPPTGVALGDMDGDGWIDLVVMGQYHTLVLRNLGAGGELSPESFADPITLDLRARGNDLALGDLTGNGLPDIVLMSWSDANSDLQNTVSIVENESSPGSLSETSFSSPIVLTTGERHNVSVLIADMNRNGNRDIVVGTGNGDVCIFPNQGAEGGLSEGTFGARIDLPIPASDGWALKVSVGDVNGDGFPDIVVPNRYDWVSIGENSGASDLNQAFSSFVQFDIPSGNAGLARPGRVTIADLNRDGRPDLVADGDMGTVHVSRNLISPLTVTGFEILPGSTRVTVPWYRNRNLSARRIMSDGSFIPLSTLASWSSDNPSVAEVSASGRVSGVAPGQTAITAEYEGQIGHSLITVEPVAFGRSPGNPDGRFLPEVDYGGEIGAVKAIAVQADGKVLAGGRFSRVNGEPFSHLVRILEDGKIDPVFNPGSGPNGEIKDLAIDPQGRILIAGRFTEVDGVPRRFLARLHQNGSLDTGFNPGFGAVTNASANAILLRPDGRILVGGRGLSPTGMAGSSYLIQLTANGDRDGGFMAESLTSGVLEAMALQDDGRVLIGGSFLHAQEGLFCVARLDTGGGLDAGFARGIETSRVLDLAVHHDGRILAVGDFSSVFGEDQRFIARLLPDGSRDTSFANPAANVIWGIVNSVAVQENGKIVVTRLMSVARLLEDGSPDPAFDPGEQPNRPDWATEKIVVLPNQMLLIGGGMTTVNGAPVMGLARLHGDVESYDTWAARYWLESERETNPAGTDPSGDFSGRGIPNLMLYALGISPLEKAGLEGGLPSGLVILDDQDAYFNFHYRARTGAADLVYQVGVSDDLETWDFSGNRLTPVGDPVPAENGEFEERTLRLIDPIGEQSEAFLKLRVKTAD